MAFSWCSISLMIIASGVLPLAKAAVHISNCDGYVSPIGCTIGVNCAYEASWKVLEIDPPPFNPNGDKTPAAQFTITIRRAYEKSANFYTAIGFSENQAMPDTDVIIGSVYNNNFLEIVDAYIEPGQFKAPKTTEQQDVLNANGSLIDDPRDKSKRILTYSFLRRLDTGDKDDINLMQCRYFFFMTSGGTVSGPRGYSKHDLTPDMSAEKICLMNCMPQHEVLGSSQEHAGSAWRLSSSWITLILSVIAILFRM